MKLKSLSLRSLYTSIPVVIEEKCNDRSANPDDYDSLAHNHKELEIMYVTGGEAVYYAGSAEYRVSAGDILLVSPYVVHRLLFSGSGDFRASFIYFDSSVIPDKTLAEELERGLLTPVPYIPAGSEHSAVLSGYIERAYSSVKCEGEGWELSLIGNISLLLAYLKERALFVKRNGGMKQSIFCFNVLKLIDENYARQLSSADVARTLFINESYFCRRFKESFASTFQKYLESYRIERAKELLRGSELSISAVSVATGFTSFSYFSKIFKQYTGQTPSEYRASF